MRLLEVLILLGCVLHLAFVKAQMAIDDETFFGKDELEPGAEEAFIEDASEPEGEEEDDENAKPDQFFQPDEKDKRGRPYPPIRYSTILYIGIPPVGNKKAFRLCHCFKKLCDVPGMTAGFKGWKVRYQSGYVVIDKTLYFFQLCKPGLIPTKPTFNPSTKPTRFTSLPPRTSDLGKL